MCEPSGGPAPFGVGEQLEFKVYFEFILGGHANMSVISIDEVDGHPCYRIVSEARSTRTVDRFYKVRDRIESWRDLEGGFSRGYNKQLREGKHRDEKRVEYKPEEGLALLYRGSSEQPETLAVEGFVLDVISAFYEVRTRELEVGKTITVNVHDIDKQYELEVEVLRKEQIEVPPGRFDCFVIEPKLQSAGIFRREGDMQIWISDDQFRMPILMKSRLYFGRVWARLIDFRRGEE